MYVTTYTITLGPLSIYKSKGQFIDYTIIVVTLSFYKSKGQFRFQGSYLFACLVCSVQNPLDVSMC